MVKRGENAGEPEVMGDGRLMLNVLGVDAQFEREMMLERQREGKAKAKAEEIETLAAGGLSMGAIASKPAIGKGSVHRVLTGVPNASIIKA